jgi:hypothetical protein
MFDMIESALAIRMTTEPSSPLVRQRAPRGLQRRVSSGR